MANYASDADIGADIFNGLTVPGVNTVNETKHLSLSARAQAFTNRVIGKAAGAEETDTYGILKEVFLIAYRAFLDQVPPKLDKQTLVDLRMRHQGVAFNIWETHQDLHGTDFGSGRWG